MMPALDLRAARCGVKTAMAAVPDAVHAAGLRRDPLTPGLIAERYLSPATPNACTVAERRGWVAGFQSPGRADVGSRYHMPAGRGCTGIPIHPKTMRAGRARALFAGRLAAARRGGLTAIGAQISAGHVAALACYRGDGMSPRQPTRRGGGNRAPVCL